MVRVTGLPKVAVAVVTLPPSSYAVTSLSENAIDAAAVAATV